MPTSDIAQRGSNGGIVVELPSTQVGALGPVNTAGAQSVAPATDSPNFPVALPDAVPVAATGGVALNTIIWQTDTRGYQTVVDVIASNPGGNTVTYEQSNDNTTWVAATARSILSAGTSLATNTGFSNTNVTAIAIKVKARYMRCRVATYVSGTTVCQPVLRNIQFETDTNPQVLAAGVNPVGKAGKGYTSAQSPNAASANGSAASGSLAATLAAVAAKTHYVTGLQVHSGGATAAAVPTVSLTGLVGGTQTYAFPVPAGATAGATPLVIAFDPPIPATAVNLAVAATLSTVGAGHTLATVNLQGYYE